MNEEQFNAIAYNYRSWPAYDPKGVSERYEELWALFSQQADRIKMLESECAALRKQTDELLD